MSEEKRQLSVLKTPWLNDAAQANPARAESNILPNSHFARHFCEKSEIVTGKVQRTRFVR